MVFHKIRKEEEMTGSNAARTVATMFAIPAPASAMLLSAIWPLNRHLAVAAVAVARPVHGSYPIS
jgi:hypothetical protein